MSSDDEQAGWVAGGAVLAGIALGGLAMAVVRRMIGRESRTDEVAEVDEDKS